ncbi:MAG: hypothetical protein U0Q15_08610 [Kineosporiaceae bacterium]
MTELDRRRLLAAGALAGGGMLLAPAAASAHGTLASAAEINGFGTFYELDATPRLRTFSYHPTFYGRLEVWSRFWLDNANASWSRSLRYVTYGVHVDRGSEAHDQGRGFDLSRIYAGGTTEAQLAFWGRYDLWSDGTRYTDEQIVRHRRLYWATAASLHYHFRHVLCYPYNTAHHNHIHVDNVLSGGGTSTFDTTSTTQVQHVQSSLRYVWDTRVSIDGVWGPQTDAASAAVVTRIGRAGSLTSSQDNWLAYNRATFRRGCGRQSY